MRVGYPNRFQLLLICDMYKRSVSAQFWCWVLVCNPSPRFKKHEAPYCHCGLWPCELPRIPVHSYMQLACSIQHAIRCPSFYISVAMAYLTL